MKYIAREPSLEKKQSLLIDAQQHAELIKEDQEHLQMAIDKVAETRLEIERNRPKKWCCCILFGILGLVFGLIGQVANELLTEAAMKRAGLDNLMDNLCGDTRMDQALTDELLLIAYNYNDRQPRLFSKRFDDEDPGIYDVKISDASSASASIPGVWSPKEIKTKYKNNEMLIDGGIVANNPSLLAYILAKYIPNDKSKDANIRMLSLSCGEEKYDKITTPAEYHKFNFKMLKDVSAGASS